MSGKLAKKRKEKKEKGKGKPNKSAQGTSNKRAQKLTADFSETINDIHRLLGKNDLNKIIHKRVVKKQKMPMVMLKGVREKRIRKYKEQEQSNREQSILYNPEDKEFDVGFYKDKMFKKNWSNLLKEDKCYKFKGAFTPGPKVNGATMTFSRDQIKKLGGKF